jgi:class 3 adenylate cyclase
VVPRVRISLPPPYSQFQNLICSAFGPFGSENPPEASFCGDCGASLGTGSAAGDRQPLPRSVAQPPRSTTLIQPEVADASEVPDGERKTVTALFADIKGSTELEQDLDPEEARAIIDPALKLMIDAARRYDGYIVQSTGDGIFALFGALVAHEHHPQRSLYAALACKRKSGAMPIAASPMLRSATVATCTGGVRPKPVLAAEAPRYWSSSCASGATRSLSVDKLVAGRAGQYYSHQSVDGIGVCLLNVGEGGSHACSVRARRRYPAARRKLAQRRRPESAIRASLSALLRRPAYHQRSVRRGNHDAVSVGFRWRRRGQPDAWAMRLG